MDHRLEELIESLNAAAIDSRTDAAARVMRGGEVVFESAWGLADRARDIPNTPDTVFSIASIVKGFTALAMMSLIDDGATTADTSVLELLGATIDGVDIDPRVTLRHLMTHTSGIGDYIDEGLGDNVNDYVLTAPVHQLTTAAEYVAVLRGRPMKAEPGGAFTYNNSGFVLLALAIEAASGRDYHDVLDERVFAPAGMVSTTFHRSDQLPANVATGYLGPNEPGWRTNLFNLPVRGLGDGGAFSTVADLCGLWPALFDGRIVAATTAAAMTTAQVDDEEEGRRYGIGFWMHRTRDVVWLEGYDAGISSRTLFDRESGLSYAVIANTSEGAWPLTRVLDAHLDALAGV